MKKKRTKPAKQTARAGAGGDAPARPRGVAKRPKAPDAAAKKRALLATQLHQPPRAGAKKKKRRAGASAVALGAVSAMRDSLEEALAASEAASRPAAAAGLSAKTNKKRLALVNEEAAQMQAILSHPAFVADPFAALQEHLRNTVAPRSEAKKKDKKGPRREGGQR